MGERPLFLHGSIGLWWGGRSAPPPSCDALLRSPEGDVLVSTGHSVVYGRRRLVCNGWWQRNALRRMGCCNRWPQAANGFLAAKCCNAGRSEMPEANGLLQRLVAVAVGLVDAIWCRRYAEVEGFLDTPFQKEGKSQRSIGFQYVGNLRSALMLVPLQKQNKIHRRPHKAPLSFYAV